LGYAKHRSGFALCGILLHHIFAALQNLTVSLIRAAKTSPILNVMRNVRRSLKIKILDIFERI